MDIIFELPDAFKLAKAITECPIAVEKTTQVAHGLGLSTTDIDSMVKYNNFAEKFQALPLMTRIFEMWISKSTSPANGKLLEDCFLNLGLVRANDLWKQEFNTNPTPLKKLKVFSTELFGVPQRLQNFTGRQEHLNNLKGIFSNNEVPGLQKVNITACHGLGGIGKTSLAIEYIYNAKNLYDFIVWFNAETVDKLEQEILDFGKRKHINRAINEDQIEIVINWFEQYQNGRWLIIFDNVPDEGTFEDRLFPRQGNGDIIITSRYSIWSHANIELDIFQEDEFVEFCKKYLKKPSLDETEVVQIKQLGIQLGYLPLAAAHALAYIVYSKTNIEKYLVLFETKKRELLQNQSTCIKKINILITWNITMDKIKTTLPEAIELIKLLGYTYPTEIHRDLITNFAGGDELFANNIIGELTSYSMLRLLRRDFQGESMYFGIHRLVQDVLRINYATEEFLNMKSLSTLLLNERIRLKTLEKEFKQNRVSLDDSKHIDTLLNHFSKVEPHLKQTTAYTSLLEKLIDLLELHVKGEHHVYNENYNILLRLTIELHGSSSEKLNRLIITMNIQDKYFAKFEGTQRCLTFLLKELKFLQQNMKGEGEPNLNVFENEIEMIKSIEEISKTWEADPKTISNYSKILELIEGLNQRLAAADIIYTDSLLAEEKRKSLFDLTNTYKRNITKLRSRLEKFQGVLVQYASMFGKSDIKFGIILAFMAIEYSRISQQKIVQNEILNDMLSVFEQVDLNEDGQVFAQCEHLLIHLNALSKNIDEFDGFETEKQMLAKRMIKIFTKIQCFLSDQGQYSKYNGVYGKLNKLLLTLETISGNDLSKYDFEAELKTFINQESGIELFLDEFCKTEKLYNYRFGAD